MFDVSIKIFFIFTLSIMVCFPSHADNEGWIQKLKNYIQKKKEDPKKISHSAATPGESDEVKRATDWVNQASDPDYKDQHCEYSGAVYFSNATVVFWRWKPKEGRNIFGCSCRQLFVFSAEARQICEKLKTLKKPFKIVNEALSKEVIAPRAEGTKERDRVESIAIQAGVLGCPGEPIAVNEASKADSRAEKEVRHTGSATYFPRSNSEASRATPIR